MLLLEPTEPMKRFPEYEETPEYYEDADGNTYADYNKVPPEYQEFEYGYPDDYYQVYDEADPEAEAAHDGSSPLQITFTLVVGNHERECAFWPGWSKYDLHDAIAQTFEYLPYDLIVGLRPLASESGFSGVLSLDEICMDPAVLIDSPVMAVVLDSAELEPVPLDEEYQEVYDQEMHYPEEFDEPYDRYYDEYENEYMVPENEQEYDEAYRYPSYLEYGNEYDTYPEYAYQDGAYQDDYQDGADTAYLDNVDYSEAYDQAHLEDEYETGYLNQYETAYPEEGHAVVDAPGDFVMTPEEADAIEALIEARDPRVVAAYQAYPELRLLVDAFVRIIRVLVPRDDQQQAYEEGDYDDVHASEYQQGPYLNYAPDHTEEYYEDGEEYLEQAYPDYEHAYYGDEADYLESARAELEQRKQAFLDRERYAREYQMEYGREEMEEEYLPAREKYALEEYDNEEVLGEDEAEQREKDAMLEDVLYSTVRWMCKKQLIDAEEEQWLSHLVATHDELILMALQQTSSLHDLIEILMQIVSKREHYLAENEEAQLGTDAYDGDYVANEEQDMYPDGDYGDEYEDEYGEEEYLRDPDDLYEEVDYRDQYGEHYADQYEQYERYEQAYADAYADTYGAEEGDLYEDGGHADEVYLDDDTLAQEVEEDEVSGDEDDETFDEESIAEIEMKYRCLQHIESMVQRAVLNDAESLALAQLVHLGHPMALAAFRTFAYDKDEEQLKDTVMPLLYDYEDEDGEENFLDEEAAMAEEEEIRKAEQMQSVGQENEDDLEDEVEDEQDGDEDEQDGDDDEDVPTGILSGIFEKLTNEDVDPQEMVAIVNLITEENPHALEAVLEYFVHKSWPTLFLSLQAIARGEQFAEGEEDSPADDHLKEEIQAEIEAQSQMDHKHQNLREQIMEMRERVLNHKKVLEEKREAHYKLQMARKQLAELEGRELTKEEQEAEVLDESLYNTSQQLEELDTLLQYQLQQLDTLVNTAGTQQALQDMLENQMAANEEAEAELEDDDDRGHPGDLENEMDGLKRLMKVLSLDPEISVREARW